MSADEDVIDDKSTKIHTRITMADGRAHEVRERYTTAKRYIQTAMKDGELAQFSTTPTSRLSVNPSAVVDVEEMER